MPGPRKAGSRREAIAAANQRKAAQQELDQTASPFVSSSSSASSASSSSSSSAASPSFSSTYASTYGDISLPSPSLSPPSADEIAFSLSNKSRKWTFDSLGQSTGVPHPIGYIAGNFNNAVDEKSSKKDPSEKLKLVESSSWQVAIGPGKSLFQTALMLYLTGNSLSIFSIMFLGMAFGTPLMSLTNVNVAFKKYEDSKASMALNKVVYVFLNLLGIGLALYKCNTMGLLAHTVTAPPLKQISEFSFGALIFR